MSAIPDRVLLVDDDQAVLDALCRQHRKLYSFATACGAEAGLAAVASDGPFAVVVTDFQMPGMNGTQFLAKARELDPSMVRVMLTGQADMQTAIDAVNRGQIFRFLTKPCDPDVFRSGLDGALEQFHLRNAERLLLEKTVKGSIEVLVDILALASPGAFGRATRIRDYVRHVAETLRLEDSWQYETAALLSQIGCIAIPNDVIQRLESGKSLTAEQAAMMEGHPKLASELLRKIPRLQTVANIVRYQRSPRSQALQEGGETVALGSCMLSAALDFEELISLGASRKQALEALRQEPRKYHPRVVEALATAGAHPAQDSVRLVPISQLLVGMVLEEDVRNVEGNLIVASGHQVTLGSLQRLRNYAELNLLDKREFRARVSKTPKTAGSSAA